MNPNDPIILRLADVHMTVTEDGYLRFDCEALNLTDHREDLHHDGEPPLPGYLDAWESLSDEDEPASAENPLRWIYVPVPGEEEVYQNCESAGAGHSANFANGHQWPAPSIPKAGRFTKFCLGAAIVLAILGVLIQNCC